MFISPSPHSLWAPAVECLVRIVPDCSPEQKPSPVVVLNPAAATISAPDPAAVSSLVVCSVPKFSSTTLLLVHVFVQTSKKEGENSVTSHAVIFLTGL